MYRGKIITNSTVPGCFDGTQKEYTVSINTQAEETVDFVPTMRTLLVFNQQDSEELILEDFPLDTDFYHFRSLIYTPIEETEEVQGQFSDRSPSYRFTDVFNHRPEEYLRFIEPLDELSLPNFFLRELKELENNRYEDIFAYSDTISSQNFFYNASDFVDKFRTRTAETLEPLKNILILANSERYGPQEKNIYPFYVHMSFEFNDPNHVIGEITGKSMSKDLLNFISEGQSLVLPSTITEKNFFQDTASTAADINTTSMNQFLRTVANRQQSKIMKLPNGKPSTYFIQNINKIKALSDILGTNFASRPRSFQQIKTNPVTGTELLFLKVEKYAGTEAAGEPIQSFWYTGDNTNYDVVDTQVKNNKYYTYKVIGFYAMDVTTYRFTNYDSVQKSVIMNSSSDIKIVQTDLLEKTVYVLQPLQLPPKVLVSADKHTNRVYFDLSLERGKMYKPFINFLPEDSRVTEVLDRTKQYEDPEHAYVFESAKFEIFRIDHEPEVVDDFVGGLLQITDRIRDRESHTFIDNLTYGRRYYYLFRAVNSEFFPGNPTQVYSIMVTQGVEENKIDVQTMDFVQQPEEYAVSKDFNSLIHIYPREEQLIMPNLTSIEGNSYRGKINEVQVGLEGYQPVWNKKFKLRITSNNTGRKMDINIRFKLKRETIE